MVNGTAGELTADGKPSISRESARSSRELNIQIVLGK
jgi:hypothetical protein